MTTQQICQLLDLCLNTTYFQYKGNFYMQNHGCALGSPVSRIVADLYMEEVESRALNSFRGTGSDMWMIHGSKSKKEELQTLTEHINSVDKKHQVHETTVFGMCCSHWIQLSVYI